jgi:hypothetical protein
VEQSKSVNSFKHQIPSPVPNMAQGKHQITNNFPWLVAGMIKIQNGFL